MPNNGKRPRKKQAVLTTRVVRGGVFPDRQFDVEFWQKQGAEAIFAAAWEMICFTEEFKNGKQPAFQRDVTKFKRSRR